MATAGVPKKLIPNWEKVRDEWVGRLTALVDQIEGWARELDWSTRRIAKRVEDSEVGEYAAPALLLQKEFARLLLDPIGRSGPGAEGVVDLYLMPAYDDVANLYLEGGKWRFHHFFPAAPPPLDASVAKAKPLTKAAVQKILGEMERRAGQVQ